MWLYNYHMFVSVKVLLWGDCPIAVPLPLKGTLLNNPTEEAGIGLYKPWILNHESVLFSYPGPPWDLLPLGQAIVLSSLSLFLHCNKTANLLDWKNCSSFFNYFLLKHTHTFQRSHTINAKILEQICQYSRWEDTGTLFLIELFWVIAGFNFRICIVCILRPLMEKSFVTHTLFMTTAWFWWECNGPTVECLYLKGLS